MKKNIAQLIDCDHVIGALNSITTLVDNLDRNKFETIVLITKRGPFEANIYEKGYNHNIIEFKINNVLGKLRYLALLPLFLIYDIIKLGLIIRRAKIDIVHSHHEMNHIINIFTSKLFGHTSIIHIRRILTVNSFLRKLVVKHIYSQADSIICISKAVSKSIPIKNKKLVNVIHNCISLNPTFDYESNKTKFFQRLIRKRTTGKIIGFAGRLDENKGLHVLIESLFHLKEFNNWHLVIVSPLNIKSEFNYLMRIENMIFEYGLDNRCSFIGSFENYTEFMPFLDLLVMPTTKKEGFGNVILEAASFNIPVIATKSGGPEDIISDGVNGYLVNKNSSEELKNMIRLFLNEELLEIEYHINEFSLPKMISKLECIYNK